MQNLRIRFKIKKVGAVIWDILGSLTVLTHGSIDELNLLNSLG